jgi:hypothetical protein
MTSLVALALLAASDAASQPASPPPGLRDFEVLQFIISSGGGPRSILQMDGNDRIVRACVVPRTREALRADGVAFTESQIALLQAWRLLDERDDGTLATPIAIVPPPATERLRATSRHAADALVERLSRPLEAFRARLGTAGRPNTSYTMLFSYVLDNLVWREWERGGLVAKRALSAKAPFWAGVVWAIAPRRAFSMGTNSISERGATLNVNWSEAAIPKMRPFLSEFGTLSQLFVEWLDRGVVASPRAREVFGPYTLLDGAGRLTVPVVVEGDADPLYRTGRALARAVATEVPRVIDLDGVAKDLAVSTREAALVIAYHEIMWDLMDAWERAGVVAKPRIFADPAAARPADVGDLVFVVRRAK